MKEHLLMILVGVMICIAFVLIFEVMDKVSAWRVERRYRRFDHSLLNPQIFTTPMEISDDFHKRGD